MHVGSLMLLERPKGKKDVFVAIRDHIAALYLAGGKLKAYYPVSIVTHGLGLNIPS
jgi:hypothetical protein